MTLWMGWRLTLAVAALCLVAGAVVAGYLAISADDIKRKKTSTPALSARIGAFMRSFFGGMYWKSVGGLLADLVVFASTFVIAVHVQFEGALPTGWTELLGWVLPGIIVGKLVVFYVAGLYEGIWRHAGTPEVVRIVQASLAASVLVGGGFAAGGRVGSEVVSVLLVDVMLTTMGVAGVRFGFRALRQYVAARRQGQRRVLICGSGSHEMHLLRHLRQTPGIGWTVVGFVDDDEDRHGYRAQGVEVLGGPEDLGHLCSDHDIDEVIVPRKTTTTEERRDVRELCREAGVACRYFDISLQDARHAALNEFVELESRVVTPSVFRQILEAEIARLERGSRSAGAVLTVEVVGRSRGQNRGDPPIQPVLEDVTRAFKRSLRSSDFVAIWNASTYYFLLVDTDEEGAWKVGERLAEEVERRGEAPGPPPELNAAVEPVRPDDDVDALFSRLRGEKSTDPVEKGDVPEEPTLSPA